jgi:D-glycero-alpha-D-manno-heptose-7-phosphate kinase
MTHHAKAPFRIGLAGGGTDVSPYCDQFGGAVVNATINKYAHASILPRNDGKIVFIQENTVKRWEGQAELEINVDEDFFLQQGVYNHIAKYFNKAPLSFELVTSMDVPTGSGLGTSSTLVVAMAKIAFG